ncbi:M56 family metallopeptidase [Chryseobacterium sp. MP_3.2]|uniref:M56 family metallopeptidase n=1 Tax=Chryseobacterium sp. MP_3.2 TaxID=3071712 RepID=UPI002E062CCE|nr:beta-lactamase regulating signal transducer with metallopeptidase domain [Chryseobacterium sp. MP_3.2]
METLLYFGKVILSSAVLFLYYRLFLKDKTFHHYNRFYLLSILVLSIFLPLLKIRYFTLEVNQNFYLLLSKLPQINSSKNSSNELLYIQIITIVFGVVSVFYLVKLIFCLLKIERLKKTFKKENLVGISFYQTNLDEAPFSYFKNLFWKNSIAVESELGQQILKHEMVHIEQKHSLDKIFLELATSLFWFNPFFYLIKKEIHLIHEYLADKKALKNSDTKAFAQMLLASHFSGKQLPTTSPFLSSNLKKRLTMLKKSKTKFSYARRILALPLLFILAFMYLVNAKNKEIKNTNLEVEQFIAAAKSDTISPNKKEQNTMNNNSLEAVQTQIAEKQKEIQPLQERFNANDGEARKITGDLQLKSEALRKLSAKNDFDSPKFKKLDSEIIALSARIDAIYNKEDFKNLEKSLNQKYGEIDQLYVKVDAFYNSEDFKNQILKSEEQAAEAEKLVNSPKFKKQIANAEKKATEAEKLMNSAEFKLRIKDAEIAAKDSQVAQEDAKISSAKMDEEPEIFI